MRWHDVGWYNAMKLTNHWYLKVDLGAESLGCTRAAVVGRTLLALVTITLVAFQRLTTDNQRHDQQQRQRHR